MKHCICQRKTNDNICARKMRVTLSIGFESVGVDIGPVSRWRP